MRYHQISAAGLATLVGSANAFTIDFWGGPRCTSTPDGAETAVYTAKNTCYTVPINSESATVKKTNDDADNDSELMAKIAS